jgi:hypothetical protein
LHLRPEGFVLDVAQEVEGFEGLPQGGEGLGEAIGRRTTGEAGQDDMGRSRPVAQRGRHPHQLIPLLANQREIDRTMEHRVEWPIVLRPIQLVEGLLADGEPRHQTVPQQVAQAKQLIGVPMLVDKMFFGAQERVVVQEPV